MFRLTNDIEFPDLSLTTKDGLLAIGGDLSVERLLLAYRSGIFPWFEIDEPLLWWSPDPRFVLFPEDLKVSKTMKQFIKKTEFLITENQAFEEVIQECSSINRPKQEGTWITNNMIDAYVKLYKLGYAKSIEVWDNNTLVAGLYGVDLGNQIFSGESMFTKVSNASKLAFIHLVKSKHYRLIDCQVHTSHLERLGATFIERKEFLKYIN